MKRGAMASFFIGKSFLTIALDKLANLKVFEV
jgi:hypothetical protein